MGKKLTVNHICQKRQRIVPLDGSTGQLKNQISYNLQGTDESRHKVNGWNMPQCSIRGGTKKQIRTPMAANIPARHVFHMSAEDENNIIDIISRNSRRFFLK